ncbi:EcoAI/FtnUII family type I restriction enzme subunit R [Cognatiyoonia sp. IB215182]|uniref:EcoAI/FtnUII family type I restriction enzme subunit R n=1 Tax=Cognatiyoonia sp. IB215182 TaxID=3097353 RepID=UPI002A0D1EDC|nr:DEAD/DEAH box helicase family protein [Cognatiyoonia sp. IB215182]MDX8353949.1 DEAD/DEAH box helicase family protein [Cognatiyoonia sp. IB215182]
MVDYSKIHSEFIPTESETDTRARRIDPALRDTGWDVAQGTRIDREEIAPGRITATGKRENPMACDYVLVYRDQKLATIEAKRAGISAAEGVAQAKEYSQRLRTRFTYATNGLEWYEMDTVSGAEGTIPGPPSPGDLWARTFESENEWRNRFGAVPFETGGGKWQPRYYQHNAITAALEAIAEGRDRILLTLATGTGKTGIAFQLCWKLFQSNWNLTRDPTRRPRILFLADRNILANQAYNSFGAFDEGARIRVDPKEVAKRGQMPTNASIFFTIFQTLTTTQSDRLGYEHYAPDFFDFIIIDECHRGGANAESSWREILQHFSPAVQLGLTATPKRTDNVDTYAYFGEPVYEYSLKEGIEDGYLTPFRVRQFASNVDVYEFDGKDEVVTGEVDDGTRFEEKDFNRIIQMRERELHRVRTFLREVDVNEKALVFCATQAHAALIRDLISQEVQHLDPNYCVRVTANDGALGEAHLERFQLNSRTIPTILTTSQKLSTGVDARNIRNIILMRPVNSMIEFKQIIGRGTRTFEGKHYFTIYDFVKAHKNFDDPAWDGDPADIIVDPPKSPGEPPQGPESGTPEPLTGPVDPGEPGDPPPRKMIEIKLADDHIVNVAATTFWGPDGKPMSAQQFIEHMYGKVPDLFKDEDELRALWSDPDTRKALMERLAEEGFDAVVLLQVQQALDAKDCDIFDVLAHIAYSRNMMTRKHRADVGRRRIEDTYDVKTVAFIDFVLNSYVEGGVANLDRSKMRDYAIMTHGSPAELASNLGGMQNAIDAYVGFQKQLYRPSN